MDLNPYDDTKHNTTKHNTQILIIILSIYKDAKF